MHVALLAQRATAFVRLERHVEALTDVQRALALHQSEEQQDDRGLMALFNQVRAVLYPDLVKASQDIESEHIDRVS